MPMIGNEAVRQRSRLAPLDGPGRHVPERIKIGRILADSHPGIGLVQHMINKTSFGRSLRSSHGRNSSLSPPK
jgi:hypothetical protein